MSDLSYCHKRSEALKMSYLSSGDGEPRPLQTGGVVHQALICSELERTIAFYAEVLGMRLTLIVQNRDEPTSTHIFFDMGGGDQLAFFDFPETGARRTVRGVGSMHHVALKTQPDQMRAIIGQLDKHHLSYSLHGTSDAGSIYVRDPDEILVELTMGY
jgi:glyoxylase I family protein